MVLFDPPQFSHVITLSLLLESGNMKPQFEYVIRFIINKPVCCLQIWINHITINDE